MSNLLNLQEQALLRGWIERIGWPTLGQLYLEGAEVAATRTAVRVLRQRLADHARHCGRWELAAFWHGEPAAGPAWTAHAQQALQAVVALPVPSPARTDPVAQWLPARITQRLAATRVVTLGDVIVRRGAAGALWWQAIARFGRRSAQTVERFLRAHAAALEISCTVPAAGPTAPPLAAVPPEWFRTDSTYSGTHGRNRAPVERCRIDAPHDYGAMQAWLGRWEAGSHTQRAYRKEAERFLLWALQARGKPLSSLTSEDCTAYRAFLRNPDAHWSGALQPRWSAAWKPFQGPLSPRSVRHAETILSALCGWLVQQRYLEANPFDGLPRPRYRPERKIQVERAFTEAEWQWLLGYAPQRQTAGVATAAHDLRLGFVLRLAHCTGLRLSELAWARFGDLASRTTPQGEQWWLRVLGKGRRERKVPLPSGLLGELQAYAATRGLRWGAVDPEVPLIGKLRRAARTVDGEPVYQESAFTPEGLHRILRTFFREAADARRATDPVAAQRFSQASTHWLRHTHATHALTHQVPLTVVRDNLGHSSLSTTSVYVHAHEDERHAAMEKLYGKLEE